MNKARTKRLVQKNGVVTLKADKTHDAPEADQLLIDLGNTAKTIPFYAIYPASGGDPITLDGPITSGRIIGELRRAGPSKTNNRAKNPGRITKYSMTKEVRSTHIESSSSRR